VRVLRGSRAFAQGVWQLAGEVQGRTAAKLNDVELFVYLKDILQRMTEGHPMRWLDELPPWN